MKESKNVIAISLVLSQPTKPRRCLVICRLLLLNKDGVLNFEPSRPRLLVIVLVVNKHDQRVAEAIDFLAGTLEGAGRLRLTNTGDLNINAKRGKIDALR